MRKYMFLFATVLIAVTCIGLVSCSKDDKDAPNTLQNSTWKIVGNESGESEFPIGMTLYFNSNGTVAFTGLPEDDMWSYAKWTYVDNCLTIVLGDGEPDDLVTGQFVINGKTATYTYHWADALGAWDRPEEINTLTLSRM